MKLAIAYDDAFLDHYSQWSHPERPERLVALKQALSDAGYWDQALHFTPREATREELCLVHSENYVDSTLERLGRGHGNLDPDTFFSEGSRHAALKAAGASIDLAKAVWNKECDLSLALVRPPGHHAEEHRAAGFCIFNNIGIAAASLIEAGAERILVYDWDVHHGNGTQHQFDLRSDIFYISVHAWPHFPGSGLSEEIGQGKGKGYTANVPYPHGATDVDYAEVMDRLIVPIAKAYKPDMILVSSGFDAHRNDMLGGMDMTEEGFAYEARIVRELADELCDGRVSLFLEGGYDLDGLCQSMIEVLRVFEGKDAPRPEGKPSPRHQYVLEETMSRLKGTWPDIG